ncbi:MAG: hypothetical protein FJ405_06780 [Verrucomicrobia bacterium]|nr:hypothetical protein [Verrucomicrobiota bacterium]
MFQNSKAAKASLNAAALSQCGPPIRLAGVYRSMTRLGGIISMIFCLLNPTRGCAQLSAGSARGEINPPLTLLNWVGHQPYPGVLDAVHVRALVISDGSNRAALVAWDLTDTREGFVARVRKEIQRATGIPADSVLINASHTHSAPWVPSEGSVLLEAERRTLLPVETSPGFQEWSQKVVQQTVDAVKRADEARKPGTIHIARAWAGDLLFNRRPTKPDGTVQTTFTPDDPFTLPGGQRYAGLDPTLAVVGFLGPDGEGLGSFFNLTCHPVSVYPHDKRISADWPGPASDKLGEVIGGESLFLQGCAGDIVPIRRNLPARDRMASMITDRGLAAWKRKLRLDPAVIQVRRKEIRLPLNPRARKETGLASVMTEVQVICMGDLAIAALPGEPLTGLAREIQRRSPYAHTLVLGYANGGGVQYVGMPGDKRRGGYEMGPVGSGEDHCGQILTDAVFELLESLRVETLTRQADQEPIHLYLLMGQSNMAGRGIVEPIDQVPHPRILMMDMNGSWRLARDPLHRDRINAGVGLGSEFARTLADRDPKITIGLIAAAEGGSPLSRWVKGGDLQDRALMLAGLAKRRGVLKGILWHQGENDSGKLADAESYAARLTTVIQDFRQALGQPELPWVMGELGEFLIKTPRPDTTHAVVINDRLRQVSTAVSHVGLVEAHYLTAMPDGIHFDTPSLREFGRRYAEKLIGLQTR